MGKHSAHDTEAAAGTRYSAGKPGGAWYAPLWPGLAEVLRVAEHGAEKYAPLDWREGQSFSTLLDCAFRHVMRTLRDPRSRDPESGCYHAAHAVWNLLVLLCWLLEGRDDCDDVTSWRGVTAEDRWRAKSDGDDTRYPEFPCQEGSALG